MNFDSFVAGLSTHRLSVPFTVSLSVFSFVFFTGWEKKTGSVSTERLLNTIALRNGALKSAKELNKLFALISITLLGVAALAHVDPLLELLRQFGLSAQVADFAAMRYDLAWHATLIAATHVVFSLWNWFRFNPLVFFSNKRWFVISVGALAFLVLAASALVRTSRGLDRDIAIALAFLIATAHFLLFSIDTGTGAVDVKPVARLPLLLAVIVLGNSFYTYVWLA